MASPRAQRRRGAAPAAPRRQRSIPRPLSQARAPPSHAPLTSLSDMARVCVRCVREARVWVSVRVRVRSPATRRERKKRTNVRRERRETRPFLSRKQNVRYKTAPHSAQNPGRKREGKTGDKPTDHAKNKGRARERERAVPGRERGGGPPSVRARGETKENSFILRAPRPARAARPRARARAPSSSLALSVPARKDNKNEEEQNQKESVDALRRRQERGSGTASGGRPAPALQGPRRRARRLDRTRRRRRLHPRC